LKKYLYIIICLLLSVSVFSQKDKDAVEALRVEFVGKRLELSKAEADKFWPVYNEYNDKIKVLRKNFRQSFKKPVDALSEKEIEELYLLDLQTKQAEAELYKNYRDKLKLIIGTKRMLKLIAAENDFKKEVIKTIQDKSD